MLSNIRDRLWEIKLRRDEKEVKIGFLVLGLVLLLVLGNVVYLNSLLLKNSEIAKPTPKATPISNSAVESSSPEPTQTPSLALATPVAKESSIKDYYINLGSGSNQSTDWTDVSGALSTFDIAQYQNIKEVHLETNINVPTANGTVSVRLFNKTDNYAVWNSERTVQSQVKGDLIISNNIIYDVGPKLYQVQMKSQLGVLANLVQSRVHVITK